MPGGVERIVERPAALWTRLNDHAQSLRMAWDGRAPGQNRLAKRRLPAEYSPALALWLVRLSACRSPGYGGPEGSHACTSCPASTSRKKTRAVPRGGRAAARLHRQPIPRALTIPPAGTPSGASPFGKLDAAAVPTARLLPAPGSTSAISRRSPAATSAPGCRRCSARWSRVGTRARTGRLGQAPARPSGGPPDPARPPGAGRQHSPLTRAILSVPLASSPATL